MAAAVGRPDGNVVHDAESPCASSENPAEGASCVVQGSLPELWDWRQTFFDQCSWLGDVFISCVCLSQWNQSNQSCCCLNHPWDIV